MDFHGAGTVVTGASGGIGEALARRFHHLGASVVVSDVVEAGITNLAAELNATRQNSVLAVTADVPTENGNKQLVATARQFLSQNGGSGIDLFFANAGVGNGTLIETTSESDWNLAFNVNVHAHRWAAKYLLEEWLKTGRGYFCSTASAAGLLSQIGSMPYSMTKSAAVAFAESLAITYGDRGIRVSCLCPQGVNTNMLNPPDAKGDVANSGGGAVKASGAVLEPAEVADIVYQTILDERFLVMPHPEVHTYEKRKVDDRDRWLSGMRRLQARVAG